VSSWFFRVMLWMVSYTMSSEYTRQWLLPEPLQALWSGVVALGCDWNTPWALVSR
jgi:hypothetical protein